MIVFYEKVPKFFYLKVNNAVDRKDQKTEKKQPPLFWVISFLSLPTLPDYMCVREIKYTSKG